MVPFPLLLAALNEIPDPRRAQGKRYPLAYLLLFTVLALLSGARSYRGIITFLEQRRDHRPRSPWPPGTPLGRGLRRLRSPRSHLGRPDRRRRPGHPPDLAQGHQIRPLAQNARNRPLRLPDQPARCRRRHRNPTTLGRRKAKPLRPRRYLLRRPKPYPDQARPLRPPSLLRPQHPSGQRDQQHQP
ncbi:transposase family protein [Rhodospirillum rubrum]|nr:transposase family protein [Rhodospirillum rubrum]